MKTILRFTTLTVMLALSFAACGPEPVTPDDGNSDSRERVVLYSVDAVEMRQTLETDKEWDALLDLFCSYAQEGKVVKFYNTSHAQTFSDKNSCNTKRAISFSTTNRDEMVAWMKEMEKQGRTVSVSFDSSTGRWNGMAYASNPSNLTSNLILGTWKLEEMVVTPMDPNGNTQDTSYFVIGENGGTLFYTFFANDTLEMTLVGAGSDITVTERALWNLTSEGELSSDLLPNSGLWNVNWITSGNLVISQTASSPETGSHYYQLQFEKQ